MPDYYELQPDPNQTNYGHKRTHIPLRLEPSPRMDFDEELFDGFVDPRMYSCLNLRSPSYITKKPERNFYDRNVIVAPVSKVKSSGSKTNTLKVRRKKHKTSIIANKAFYPPSDESCSSDCDKFTLPRSNIPVYVYENYNKKNKYLPKKSRRLFNCAEQRKEDSNEFLQDCCQPVQPECCKTKPATAEEEFEYVKEPIAGTSSGSSKVSPKSSHRTPSPTHTKSSFIRQISPVSVHTAHHEHKAAHAKSKFEPCLVAGNEDDCCKDIQDRLNFLEKKLHWKEDHPAAAGHDETPSVILEESDEHLEKNEEHPQEHVDEQHQEPLPEEKQPVKENHENEYCKSFQERLEQLEKQLHDAEGQNVVITEIDDDHTKQSKQGCKEKCGNLKKLHDENPPEKESIVTVTELQTSHRTSQQYLNEPEKSTHSVDQSSDSLEGKHVHVHRTSKTGRKGHRERRSKRKLHECSSCSNPNKKALRSCSRKGDQSSRESKTHSLTVEALPPVSVLPCLRVCTSCSNKDCASRKDPDNPNDVPCDCVTTFYYENGQRKSSRSYSYPSYKYPSYGSSASKGYGYTGYTGTGTGTGTYDTSASKGYGYSGISAGSPNRYYPGTARTANATPTFSESPNRSSGKSPAEMYKCYSGTCGGFGKGPVDIGYATTIVSRFRKYTVYEILRPSTKRPYNMCRVTENVFVVKNHNQH